MKAKKIDYSDVPELTPEELKRFRRVTPEEHARFRQAYINTFGEPAPGSGRPRKHPSELFNHVHMRMPPDILARVKAKAKRLGVGYQTLINRILAQYI